MTTLSKEQFNQIKPGEVYKIRKYARVLYREPYNTSIFSVDGPSKAERIGAISDGSECVILETQHRLSIWWIRIMVLGTESPLIGWLDMYDNRPLEESFTKVTMP